MNRRFGIELEIIKLTQDKADAALRAIGMEVVRRGYTHDITREWKIVPDGSVRDENGAAGCEAVSPILEGQAGLNAAAAAANALKTMGSSVNKSTGYHCHVSIDDLDVNDIKIIMRRYALYEQQIDAFMPPSRRGNTNYYCKSIRSLVDSDAFKNARTIEQLVASQSTRYHKVNLQSWLKYKTLEFRQHSGTVDADKIQNWIIFLDAFIAESIRIARSQAPINTPTTAIPAATGARLTRTQKRALNAISQPGGATVETIAEQLGVQIHSARAVVTRIRQAGYRVEVSRRNGQYRYEVAANTPPSTPSNPLPATDNLYAGINADIVTFYRNRAAVLAIA